MFRVPVLGGAEGSGGFGGWVFALLPQRIWCIFKALNLTQERKLRRKSVLHRIKNLNLKDVDTFPDPEKLIREDRDR
jgi:hypothetical protein